MASSATVGGDLSAEAALLHSLVDDAQAVGLLHAVENGLLIPGGQGDQVDDLGLDAVLGQQGPRAPRAFFMPME